jgi:hypothetical protein
MVKAKTAQTVKPKAKIKKDVAHNKPNAPDKINRISLADLARRSGTSRQAVTQWVNLQEKAGVTLTVPAGRRGKLINPENPLVRNYIANTYGKTRRGEKDGENKSPHLIRKLSWQSKQIKLKNQILRGKHIEREAALAFFDRFIVLEDKAFSGFSDRLMAKIEKRLNVTIFPENRAKARALIDGHVQSAKESNRRIVHDFKESTALKNAPAKNTA